MGEPVAGEDAQGGLVGAGRAPRRVLLVDDSAAIRKLIAARLLTQGYAVTQAEDGMVAADLALAQPPDVVVTDLWMPGMSGVQLCRLLRAEKRTAHVPVVLVTGESQRRSRFWAKTAGASGYVAKGDPAALSRALEAVFAHASPQPRGVTHSASRTPVLHRLCQSLDAALFESIVSGEVRALANDAEDADNVFKGLATLASEVAAYRWLAVYVGSESRLFVHARSEDASTAVAEARAALVLPDTTEATQVSDERALSGSASPPLVAPIGAGSRVLGAVAMGPGPKGASREDREVVSIIAAELGGALRLVSVLVESKKLATRDSLTGLLNRRAFSDAMARMLADFERHGEPTSIVLLDVDHFKAVNDTHGHDAGDAVLVGIANVLPRAVRRGDLVSRWGGEEFVLGLSHAGVPNGLIAAERIRRAVEAEAIRFGAEKTLSVTVSLGVAAAVRGEGLDSIIARADGAMYRAKSGGRNRCVSAEGDGS